MAILRTKLAELAERKAAFERQVADDKDLNFRGTARIYFTNLAFPDPVRLPNSKNVKRLERAFAKAGCLQHELKYSIPAIIEDHILELELGSLGITAKEFRDTSQRHPRGLQLQAGTMLEGLHGQHRILAGAAFLSLSEQWWTVDLYGQGLADKTKERMREGYDSSSYTDGDIFRQIRLSQLQNDRLKEDRWTGQLSNPKERDLRVLLKRTLLTKALDSMLPLRGVWEAFKLGSMDVFLPLRCDEEIAHYIALIVSTLRSIVGEESLIEFIDEATINGIQLRAPAVSKDDGEFITNQMQSRELFPGIKDPLKRTGILHRLLAVDFLIPSLYTLFKDIRYLEPAAELLKALVPGQNGTVRESLRFHFLCLNSDEITIPIQQNHHSHIMVRGKRQDIFEIVLRELWLCSLRTIPTPIGNAPKRDMNPEKRTDNAPNYLLWFEMVKLAHRLGFSSPEITRILETDPLKKTVADMLFKSIPLQLGKFSDVQIQSLTEDIKRHLAQSTGSIEESSTPWITVHGLGEPLFQRCGIWPDKRSDTTDRDHLFLGKVHAPVSEYRNGGGGISSFFVKRCRYLAFLGPASLSDIVGSGITEVPQN